MERIRRSPTYLDNRNLVQFWQCAFRQRCGRLVPGLQPAVSYRVGTVPLIGYGTLDLIPKKVVKWLRIPSTSACLTYEPVLTSTGRGRLKVLFTLSRIPLPRAALLTGLRSQS